MHKIKLLDVILIYNLYYPLRYFFKWKFSEFEICMDQYYVPRV
jgi:hypothetical protein